MNDEIFLHELKEAKVPFGDVIENNQNFLIQLYSQYLQAELKPSRLLYRRQFFTDQEVQSGIEEAHAKIPRYPSGSGSVMASFISLTDFERRLTEFDNDFWTKVAEAKNNGNERGVFDVKYSCHDIEGTSIVITLRNIGNQYNLFLDPSLLQENNYFEIVKLIASNILKYSKDLGEYGVGILNEIVKPGDPPFKYLMTKGGFDEWEKLRGILEALWFPEYSNDKEATTPRKVDAKENRIPTQKYTDKHYALTYIFDMYAKGEQIPKSDGGFAAKTLRKKGQEITNKRSGDGFYRAVKYIAESIDLNNRMALSSISQNWRDIILELSSNSTNLNNYLTTKGL